MPDFSNFTGCLVNLTKEQADTILPIYTAAVLKDGEMLWIGSVPDNAENLNFTATNGGNQSPCVAVDSTGFFYNNIPCETPLLSLCQFKLEGTSY